MRCFSGLLGGSKGSCMPVVGQSLCLENAWGDSCKAAASGSGWHEANIVSVMCKTGKCRYVLSNDEPVPCTYSPDSCASIGMRCAFDKCTPVIGQTLCDGTATVDPCAAAEAGWLTATSPAETLVPVWCQNGKCEVAPTGRPTRQPTPAPTTGYSIKGLANAGDTFTSDSCGSFGVLEADKYSEIVVQETLFGTTFNSAFGNKKCTDHNGWTGEAYPTYNCGTVINGMFYACHQPEVTATSPSSLMNSNLPLKGTKVKKCYCYTLSTASGDKPPLCQSGPGLPLITKPAYKSYFTRNNGNNGVFTNRQC
jgi:hypothetical protein